MAEKKPTGSRVKTSQTYADNVASQNKGCNVPNASAVLAGSLYLSNSSLTGTEIYDSGREQFLIKDMILDELQLFTDLYGCVYGGTTAAASAAMNKRFPDVHIITESAVIEPGYINTKSKYSAKE